MEIEKIDNDEDVDITDTIPEELNRWRQKYQREIMIPLFIILIMLVVFLGYAVGAAKVCDQMGGTLDGKLKCRLDYKLNNTLNLERQNIIDMSVYNLTK